jgi:hypothetical protein
LGRFAVIGLNPHVSFFSGDGVVFIIVGVSVVAAYALI